MADLIIQSGDQFHDAGVLGTFGSPTLTVAAGDHVHAADNVTLYQLTMQKALHDHVANHVTLSETAVLVVAGCYHRHVGEATYAAIKYTLVTDPLSPPKLPVLSVEAATGVRGDTAGGGLMLPGISIEARAGLRIDGNLPVMELSASGSVVGSLELGERLPAMSISAQSGARADALTMPTMEISASAENHRGSLSRTLPGVTVSATGSRASAASFAADLPPVEAVVTISAEVTASLDATIPPFLVSAAGSRANSGTLEGTLPALESSAAGGSNQLTLDASLPTLVLQPTSGDGPGSGVIELATRYDDYVLRYAR